MAHSPNSTSGYSFENIGIKSQAFGENFKSHI